MVCRCGAFGSPDHFRSASFPAGCLFTGQHGPPVSALSQAPFLLSAGPSGQAGPASGVAPDNVSPTKCMGKQNMARGAATKCVGIQNMARGLPHFVSPAIFCIPLPYLVSPSIL